MTHTGSRLETVVDELGVRLEPRTEGVSHRDDISELSGADLVKLIQRDLMVEMNKPVSVARKNPEKLGLRP